jgi:hypothetical protein
VDLLEEPVSTIPPADVRLYERDTNAQGTSLVESLTAILNSQEDDCGNESTGESFITLHAKFHLPKLSVPVGLFPDMPVDYDYGRHPIDSVNATLSLPIYG